MDRLISEQIRKILITSLRRKFQSYKPESSYMPFHTRLLGKDRMALFSFIHSLNTNFGTSIFEPVAVELSRLRFKEAYTHQDAGNLISRQSQIVITEIMNELSISVRLPNKSLETEMIKKVAKTGSYEKVKLTKVDLMLISNNNDVYLIDLKSAKPNSGEFKGFKRTLLEWVAAKYLDAREYNSISSIIGITYNPYEPKPYERWTMSGMIDINNELKVANELWDFIGGEGSYESLLDIFEQVGVELRPEIDAYFNKYNTIS